MAHTFYKILMPSHLNPCRNLIPLGARNPNGKEAIMLDFAFVALGFAVIALMGFYAIALRRL